MARRAAATALRSFQGTYFAFFPGHVLQAVANLVHNAALPLCLWQDGFNRLGEPFQPIDTGHKAGLEASVFEFRKDGQPKLRAFTFAEPYPEEFLLPLQSATQSYIDRFGLYRSLLTRFDGSVSKVEMAIFTPPVQRHSG